MEFYKVLSLLLLLAGLCAKISAQNIVVSCQDNRTHDQNDGILKQILLHSENFLKYTEEQNQKWKDADRKMQQENAKLTSEIQDIKVHCEPKPQLDPLRFDTHCGKNIKIQNEGRQAVREPGKSIGYTGALTRRPLRPNELFEVRFGKTESDKATIDFGVMEQDPAYYAFPYSMITERNGCRAYLQSHFRFNGQVIINPYGQNLDGLKTGDRVGVMRKSDGSLHFYINGQDQGRAATNVPERVYGFIDLFWGGLLSVDIVEKY